MILRTYFVVGSVSKEAGTASFRLISNLKLYLTDFSNRIFSGENAKNHDFYGKIQQSPLPFTICVLTILWRNRIRCYLYSVFTLHHDLVRRPGERLYRPALSDRWSLLWNSYKASRRIVPQRHREAALAAVAIHKQHQRRSPGLPRFARNDTIAAARHSTRFCVTRRPRFGPYRRRKNRNGARSRGSAHAG
jgi:hypothetical protein